MFSDFFPACTYIALNSNSAIITIIVRSEVAIIAIIFYFFYVYSSSKLGIGSRLLYIEKARYRNRRNILLLPCTLFGITARRLV